MTKEIKSIRS